MCAIIVDKVSLCIHQGSTHPVCACSGNHNTILCNHLLLADHQSACIPYMSTCTVHVHMPSVYACIWDKEDLLTSIDYLLGSIEL